MRPEYSNDDSPSVSGSAGQSDLEAERREFFRERDVLSRFPYNEHDVPTIFGTRFDLREGLN
jgi:hypothetical protein